MSRSCFLEVTAGTGCDCITLSISSGIILAISFVGCSSFITFGMNTYVSFAAAFDAGAGASVVACAGMFNVLFDDSVPQFRSI